MSLQQRLSGGGEVVLAAGVHPARVMLETSVTVRGEPGTVLDGGRQGPVVAIDADGLTVKLVGLTLQNGAAEAGGGVCMSGWSELVLEGCVIEGNQATLAGGGTGGGVYLHRGTITLVDCVLRGNVARVASALCITGAARAEVRGGRIEGDVLVAEGAELTFDNVVVAGKVRARGTTTRAPTLVLRGAVVEGGIENDVNLPATVVVEAEA